MARIEVDLTVLAQIDIEGIEVFKALVKLNAGQDMERVQKDLNLTDLQARQVASYLVTKEGEQRLPFLFCQQARTDLDVLCIAVTQNLNRILGTEYRPGDVKKYVRVWYDRGFVEITAYTNVVADRARAWRSEPKLKTHLRPATLFGNKFEEYRNLSMIASNDSDRTDLEDEFTGV